MLTVIVEKVLRIYSSILVSGISYYSSPDDLVWQTLFSIQ